MKILTKQKMKKMRGGEFPPGRTCAIGTTANGQGIWCLSAGGSAGANEFYGGDVMAPGSVWVGGCVPNASYFCTAAEKSLCDIL